ncbi:ERF family protein [Tsuneonella sp. HG249]
MIARVYHAINAVGAALAEDGVAKTRLNARDNYLYRSIDDVLARLAPQLATHRLCILPRVLEREATERQDEAGGLLVSVTLRVAFDLVSAEDGSCHTIEAYGEALDAGDRATPKAMQSAYKYAVLQAFCVPAIQQEDADARSHRLVPANLPAEPAGGWEPWCDNLTAQLEACASLDAMRQLQDDNRASLAALSRERPELYRQIGEAIVRARAVVGRAPSIEEMPAARQLETPPPEVAEGNQSGANDEPATAEKPRKTRTGRRKNGPITNPAAKRCHPSRANGSGTHG